MPLLLAEKRIKDPYSVLWVGCKDGFGGIKVRSATTPDCSPVEVEAVFRWDGSTWTLVEGGYAQEKFCKVGDTIR